MMLVQKVLFALAVVVSTSAAPAPDPIKHVLHEKRDREPLDWVKRTRVDRDAILPMRIGLSQNNLDQGEAYLMEV